MKYVGSSGADTKVSFYSRKNNTRSVFVEGFANRYKEGEALLVDRGNDLIQPSAWNLDNFQTNGIILFNHDRDNPVGRAVKIEKNDDGLFIKAKMSDSDHPEVSRIRDLVKDGVLKAFSVGFDPKQMNEEELENGKKVNMIKEAELLEVSIVSLPMAERSLFNVTAKALADLPYDVARKACMGELNVYEDDGKTQTPQLVEVIDKVTKKAKMEDEEEEEEEEEKAGDDAAEIVGSQPKESEATSPLLDQIRQTNILMSTLISEVKLMSQKLDKAEVEKMEEEEEEEEESKAGKECPECGHPLKMEDEEEEEEEEEEEGKMEGEEEEEEEEDGKMGHEEEEEEEEEDEKKLKLVDDLHSHCDTILRKYGF